MELSVHRKGAVSLVQLYQEQSVIFAVTRHDLYAAVAMLEAAVPDLVVAPSKLFT
jgi:hypothetical protein